MSELLKNDSQLTIIADVKEERSGIFELLRDKGINLQVQPLKIGDYLLSESVGIERKTAVDFVSAIKTKRLFRQVIDLKANYEKPLLLIEGYHLYKVQGVKISGIRGALAMIAVGCSLPIFFTVDQKDTAEFLITIARQEQILKPSSTLYPKPKAKRPGEEIRRILEAFPGIGPTIAEELLVRYKSIGEIFQASAEELKTVPLIGEKKAQRIKEILNREYFHEGNERREYEK